MLSTKEQTRRSKISATMKERGIMPSVLALTRARLTNMAAIRTQEQKDRISATKKQQYTNGTVIHPMLGQHHSLATKEKISIAKKALYASGALIHPLLGKPAPWAVGSRNVNWNGGSSRTYKTGYYSTAYKKWRQAVFLKDAYTCQRCDATGYITAHHVLSWAKNPQFRFTVENGLTLCETCHALTDNYKGRAKNKILQPWPA